MTHTRWAVFGTFALAGWLFAAANGCSTGPTDGAAGSGESTRIGTTKQRLVALDLSVVSVTIGPRVAPNGTLPVSITVKNTGTDAWTAGNVTLSFKGEGTWSNANLVLGSNTAPNANATFTGNLGAPAQIGLYTLSWDATSSGTPFGATITGRTEITCSDGIFCNGDERWVNGKCVAGPPPCDDGVACTTDSCDEVKKLCSHALGASCAACFAKNCNPSCKGGAVCGDDGCGGSCGACPAGNACLAGQCVVASTPGTCASPLPLVAAADPSVALAPGFYSITGDNTDGFDEVIPACDPVAAPEKVYQLVVNQPMGIDAQSYGIDTVLSIHSGSCGGSLVKCSDDAAPPGNYGSHVYALLQPGTYLLVVNGFDTHATGPFTLDVRLVANCVPQCDGKFCGDDGCGGQCAVCPAGQICNTASRCVSQPCVPQCQGRQCGTDGCGGTCGTCQTGKACDEPSGACKNAPTCDHAKPVCPTPCSSKQYCGVDCACHQATDPRPDLVVDEARLANEILFDTLDVSPSSCTVVEKCVGGTGLRKLLRFSVEAVNQGSETLTVPPPKQRPDLFDFSSCHGHYHFQGFASYALRDLAGNLVVQGQKLAYCMEDTLRHLDGPEVGCDKKFDCTNQGIQAGWSDIYGNSLDCQWLDITDVAPGNYQLSVTVNPIRAFEEASFDNNTATVPVTIPGIVVPPVDGGSDAGPIIDSGAGDSGAGTDSGVVTDSGTGPQDAAADATTGNDASTSPSDASTTNPDSGGSPRPAPTVAATSTDGGGAEGSGCDCRAAPASTSGAPAAGGIAFLALALGARLRRRPKNDRSC